MKIMSNNDLEKYKVRIHSYFEILRLGYVINRDDGCNKGN